MAVDNVLKSWRARSLSFRGKSLVINALALSRIWYVASLIHMPPWVLRELSSLVFSFFWSGKRDLVSRPVVIQPSVLGGFSVVDVSLKCGLCLVSGLSGLPLLLLAGFLLCLFGLKLILMRLL